MAAPLFRFLPQPPGISNSDDEIAAGLRPGSSSVGTLAKGLADGCARDESGRLRGGLREGTYGLVPRL